MPKYKVGDVAALFPKPSTAKTDTGKKIQSLFDDFYKNSRKLNKTGNVQFDQKKKQVIPNENNSEGPRKLKKKKRKHVDVDDSVANSQDINETLTKQKKVKLDSAHQNLNEKSTQEEENYFPRNKKRSKSFNSIKETSSEFPKMHFDDGEDESFSRFDYEESQPSLQKKKKKVKLSQIETVENKEQHKLKNKSSKKMKKNLNSENQSAEADLTLSDTFEKLPEMKQSPEKKSKKKNKKQKKAKIVQNEDVTQGMHSDSKDTEILSEDAKLKSKVKSKKNKQLLSGEQNSETHESTEKIKESSEIISTKKIVHKKPVESAERLSRTLFVGNLPVNMTKQALNKLFATFGPIETCRLRGIVPVKTTIPKKIAAIKNEHHAGQKRHIGYVVFKDVKDATDAIVLNGLLVGDHHIVVNPASSAGEKKTYDEKRSIFIGNLPFDVDDEAIWSAFAVCGEIEAVRAIRDHETGAGKGFGYVLFQNIHSKQIALKKDDIKISDRKIRIKEIKSNSRKPITTNNKSNAMRRKAKKLKSNQNGPNSRKSLKKLMNKERLNYQKKKIAGIFKKFSN